MFFDGRLKKLVSCAFEAERNVFLCARLGSLFDLSFDSVKTAVLLPGTFYGEGRGGFSDARRLPGCGSRLCPPNLLFADIRDAADEGFREFLTRARCGRLAVPFAELADSAEYGYRRAYSWIGEYKAERPDFCQTAAFFSRPFSGAEELAAVYGAGGAVAVGEEDPLDIRAVRVPDRPSQFSFLASEVEKDEFKKTVIYFTTRLDAMDFAGFLFRRGTPFARFSGALGEEEARTEINRFACGETSVMLATKSFIASSGFVPAERVFYCGVPYSLSHLSRCCAFLKAGGPLVVFNDGDFVKNTRIISSFSKLVEDKSVCERRLKNLFEIKDRLSGCKERE